MTCTLGPRPRTSLPKLSPTWRPAAGRALVRCQAGVQPHGPQHRLRQALGWVQRGGMDVALAAGVLGGGASLFLPQLHDGVLAVAGAAGATGVAAAAARAVQRALVPDLYYRPDEHLSRAAQAWDEGKRARALHHILLAHALTPEDERLADRRYFLGDRMIEEVVAYALAQRNWPVLKIMTGELNYGRREYWEIILAAHQDGMTAQLPLEQWARRLLVHEPLPVSVDEAVQLADILVAAGPHSQDILHGESFQLALLACARAARRGDLDTPTLHRLVRIFYSGLELSRTTVLQAANQSSGQRARLLAVDDLLLGGRVTQAQRDALLVLVGSLAEVAAWDNKDELVLGPLREFAAGRQTYQGMSLALAAYNSATTPAQIAILRLAVAQFFGGDTPGSLTTLRRTNAYSHGYAREPGRPLPTVFGDSPGILVQIFDAALQARDQAAIERLLPQAYTVPPALRPALMDGLQAMGLLHYAIGFCTDGQLLLRSLSLSRIQALAPAIKNPTRYLTREEDEGLQALLSRYDGPALPAVLRAWKTAAHTPELAAVFSRLGQTREWKVIAENLAPALDQGQLSDRGFLLALHLMNAAPHLSVEHPRFTALLHNQSLLKNEQRWRRLLSALAQLGKLRRVGVGQEVLNLLLWPDDGQLRGWLIDECQRTRTAQMQALQGLAAGTCSRAEARAARDDMEHRVESLHLHAAHLRAQRDREGVRTHRAALSKDSVVLRAHLQGLSTQLAADSAGRALVRTLLGAPSAQAEEQAGKALNAWRKERSKQPDAELAAQVSAVASLCVQRSRIVRQLRKPMPAASLAPMDFLTAHPESKVVQALFNQHVLPLQMEALEAMVCVDAYGGEIVWSTPQELLAEKARVMHINDASHPAFNAMLERFRDQRLFWSFASRMRQYRVQHREGFDQTLEHLLAGTHTEQRRGSPQMQALFSGGQRVALRDAWEAGAWSEVPRGELHAGMRLHDTGAFEDFASSGDEIAGSCHSLISGGYYQYLMGRVVCGSKRMVTIKDATGKMLARAVIRLMLDDQDQPVVLLSKTYAAGRDRTGAETALRTFALERAQALGVPLVFGNDGRGRKALRVHCKTGTFPEYWDEGNSGNELQASVLWEPAARAA